MLSIKAYYMGIILLATHSVLTHSTMEPMSIDSIPNSPENNNDGDTLSIHKRPSFFVGSRYGRSGVSAQSFFATSKARRLNVVPRNDRFFLGSRYGKRADEYMSPYEQDANTDAEPSFSLSSSLGSQTGTESRFENKSTVDGGKTNFMMSCIYTGRRNYYRCSAMDDMNHIIRRLTMTHNDGGDIK